MMTEKHGDDRPAPLTRERVAELLSELQDSCHAHTTIDADGSYTLLKGELEELLRCWNLATERQVEMARCPSQ